MKLNFWNLLSLLSTGSALFVIFSITKEWSWVDNTFLVIILFFSSIILAIIFGYLGNRIQPGVINTTNNKTQWIFKLPIVILAVLAIMVLWLLNVNW